MKITDTDNMHPAIHSIRGRCGMASRWMLLMGALLLSNVAHAYTATASPTGCVDVTTVGTLTWANPTRAYASDNSYATAVATSATGTQLTHYLKCTGYGFNIPAGATINGITVGVERKISSTTNTSGKDNIVQLLKAGSLVGSNLATATAYTTTDVVEAHGSAANLWGTTWTDVDINNANFGVSYSGNITKTSTSTTRTISVDQIQITVDFSLATTWPAGTYFLSASPTGCSNVTGVGTLAWTNPTRAFASDNSYATAVATSATGTQLTNYLKCTGYGFNIPAGATVNGITVGVERKISSTTSTSGKDNIVQLLKAGSLVGSNLATATAYTTTDVVEAHGSAANLWGTTWTDVDINNANFGVSYSGNITKTSTSTTRTISVDYMPITVTFTVVAIVNPGDFNTYDTGTAPAGAIDGLIKTKVAGQSFSLDIAALNLAKTALLTTYTQTVKVELLNASSGGVLDANNCNAGWGTIQTLPNQTFAAGDAAITGSAGRHRVTGIVENNAWRNVAVRVSYPAVGAATSIGCSTDHFAIRPSSFSAFSLSDTDWQTAGTTRLLTNITAAGGVMHKAGQPFTVQATAVNAAGTPATTTNYVATPTAVACVRSGGVNVCNVSDLLPAGTAACSGTACIGTPDILAVSAAVAGVINSTATTYSDVGSFTLQLQDTTFSLVDAADGTLADCTGRYVCSSTLDVGRFVPDHYTITFAMTNARLVNRSDLPVCEVATTGDIAAADTALTVASATGFAVGDQVLVAGAGASGDDLVSAITAIAGTAVTLATAASTDVVGAVVQKAGFSYMDEALDLGFTIEAHNASELMTQNYTGALAKLNLVTPASFGFAAADGSNYFLTSNRLSLSSSSGAWSTGTADVSVTLDLSSLPNATTPRTGAADGPYNNLYFGVNASDPDGVGMLSADYDLNTDATAGFDHVKINSAPAQLRFGRLKLSNAYGSELLDLPISIETQYWNGMAFVTNTADNCTTLNVANMSLSNYQPATGALTVANMDTPARSHISLGGSPVGVFLAGRGTLKLIKPTGALTGRGSVTLTENLVAGSMTYLQGAWTGTSYTQNPSALATFGVYKGANEFIYLRENY
jgi:MSHA biogenesis protein MshQ